MSNSNWAGFSKCTTFGPLDASNDMRSGMNYHGHHHRHHHHHHRHHSTHSNPAHFVPQPTPTHFVPQPTPTHFVPQQPSLNRFQTQCEESLGQFLDSLTNKIDSVSDKRYLFTGMEVRLNPGNIDASCYEGQWT